MAIEGSNPSDMVTGADWKCPGKYPVSIAASAKYAE
jgi:hypothetical protein